LDHSRDGREHWEEGIAKVNDFEQSGFQLAKILARGCVFPYGRILGTKSWTLAKFGSLQGWSGGLGGGKIAKVNDFEQFISTWQKSLPEGGCFLMGEFQGRNL